MIVYTSFIGLYRIKEKGDLQMKKFFEEFKQFIAKGDAMSMAVGLIVGSAFTAIVTSLTENIIGPLLGILLGGIDFSGIVLTLGEAKDRRRFLHSGSDQLLYHRLCPFPHSEVFQPLQKERRGSAGTGTDCPGRYRASDRNQGFIKKISKNFPQRPKPCGFFVLKFYRQFRDDVHPKLRQALNRFLVMHIIGK